MPLPTPRSNESESNFMARCMKIAKNEFPNKQAIAVCLDLYRKNKLNQLKGL